MVPEIDDLKPYDQLWNWRIQNDFIKSWAMHKLLMRKR